MMFAYVNRIFTKSQKKKFKIVKLAIIRAKFVPMISPVTNAMKLYKLIGN